MFSLPEQHFYISWIQEFITIFNSSSGFFLASITLRPVLGSVPITFLRFSAILHKYCTVSLSFLYHYSDFSMLLEFHLLFQMFWQYSFNISHFYSVLCVFQYVRRICSFLISPNILPRYSYDLWFYSTCVMYWPTLLGFPSVFESFNQQPNRFRSAIIKFYQYAYKIDRFVYYSKCLVQFYIKIPKGRSSLIFFPNIYYIISTSFKKHGCKIVWNGRSFHNDNL